MNKTAEKIDNINVLGGAAMARVPDPTGLLSNCGFVLVAREWEATANESGVSGVSSRWGILKPESSIFSLKAVSLNDAYSMMKERRLLCAPPYLREKYLASDNFSTQTEGLVRAGEKVIEEYSVVEGLVKAGRKASEEYYTQEPWQITVSLGGSKQLTWALMKDAQPCALANLRDGRCEAGQPMVGPSLSSQLAQEFSFDPSKAGDMVTKKRRKRMTNAKRVQLEDPKLFKVGSSQKKKKKRGKKRGKKNINKENLRMEEIIKQGNRKVNKKYLHFQDFLESRRVKKQERQNRKTVDKENERKLVSPVNPVNHIAEVC